MAVTSLERDVILIPIGRQWAKPHTRLVRGLGLTALRWPASASHLAVGVCSPWPAPVECERRWPTPASAAAAAVAVVAVVVVVGGGVGVDVVSVGVDERPRRPRTALAGRLTVDELGRKTARKKNKTNKIDRSVQFRTPSHEIDDHFGGKASVLIFFSLLNNRVRETR